MTGQEQLAAGERAEAAGDFAVAAAAYRGATTDPDTVLAADAYFRLGRVTWRQGRFDFALQSFETARVLAEREDSHELLARIYNGIGAVHYARGDYAAARGAYAIAQARTRDQATRGKIILNLGVIENIEGNFAEAREHYEQAFHLFDVSGDRASAMLALHNRGMVEADLERWDDADASFMAALALATETGNREMVAKTLVNRSEVLSARGLLSEAIEHCERALRIYADVGDEVGRGEALRWRAHALRRAGEHAEAERSANDALQIATRSGARLLEAEAIRELGELAAAGGDAEEQVKLLHRAAALFAELGARREAEAIAARLAR